MHVVATCSTSISSMYNFTFNVRVYRPYKLIVPLLVFRNTARMYVFVTNYHTYAVACDDCRSCNYSDYQLITRLQCTYLNEHLERWGLVAQYAHTHSRSIDLECEHLLLCMMNVMEKKQLGKRKIGVINNQSERRNPCDAFVAATRRLRSGRNALRASVGSAWSTKVSARSVGETSISSSLVTS